MSDPLHQKDDSWLAHLNCPRYFDFSAALQAPCSTDLQYNPPLHDFVYQSDEESNSFFRNAAPSTPSPIPMHEQPRMLDPRHFGKPIYRHRPKTTFEDFLRQYHVRRRKQRRSAYAIGSGDITHPQPPDPPTPSSSSTANSRSRYKSLPLEQTNQSLLSLELSQAQDEEDTNRAGITNTPVKGPSGTPASSRRTPHRNTPSRVRHPASIARSLFLTPSSPSPSPLRKARRNPQSLRSTSAMSAEQLSSPLTQTVSNVPQKAHRGESLKSSCFPATISLRPPARTTPPESNGILGDSSNPTLLLKTTFESKPQSNRGDKKSPDFLGLPRRNIRPLGSTTSSSSDSPSVPFVTQVSSQNKSKSHGSDPQSQERNQNKAPLLSSVSPPIARPRSLRNRESKVIRDCIHDINGDQRPENSSAEIDDPDLLRKVKEHNRRLRKSGRHIPKDLLDTMDETPSRPEKRPDCSSESQTDTCAELAPMTTIRSAQSKHMDMPEEATLQLRPLVPKLTEFTASSSSDMEVKLQSEQSLQDLLSSENDRVIQERRQRLSEQRRARKLNKESFLRRMEGRGFTPQMRVSAKVVFTPSTNAQKQQNRKGFVGKENPVGRVGFSSDSLERYGRKPTPKLHQRKGAEGFKARSKSATTNLSCEDQNCNPNLSRNSVDSRWESTKEPVTDRVKALARQKRQEEKMANDLKSMLSLHNTKVRNKRSGRG